MSYSRWSTSCWYTYWSSTGESTSFKLPTKRLKNNQVFCICNIPSYNLTYGNLEKFGIDFILNNVKIFYLQEHKGSFLSEIKDGEMIYEDKIFESKEYTNEELEELKGYILEWKQDIDNHFKLFEFFKHEWYYPIRNNICWKIKDIKQWIIKNQ